MGNSFDEKAATWDENPRRIKLVNDIWSILEKELDFDKIQSVLDYGCGTGLLGYKMIDQAAEVIFCDTSTGMLEQVEKKRDYYGYSNVRTLSADFTQEIPANTKVDLVASMLVAHHVKDLNKLFTTFHSILNENGLFCLIDLDKEDGSFHDDNTGIHHFGFSKEELKKLMTESKFEIEFYNKQLNYAKEREGEIQKYPLVVLIGRKVN